MIVEIVKFAPIAAKALLLVLSYIVFVVVAALAMSTLANVISPNQKEDEE